MEVKHLSGIVACLLLMSGCQHYGMLVKRESELNCPTDIRRTVPWCAGEDAIFCCPCGPDDEFYGYKPTCWGSWPAAGAEWRDVHCGPLQRNSCNTCIEGSQLPGIPMLPLEQLSPPEGVPTTVEPSIVEPALETAPALPAEDSVEPMPNPETVPPLGATPAHGWMAQGEELVSSSLPQALPPVTGGPTNLPTTLLNPTKLAVEESAPLDLTSWLNDQAEKPKPSEVHFVGLAEAEETTPAMIQTVAMETDDAQLEVVPLMEAPQAFTQPRELEQLSPVASTDLQAARPQATTIEIIAPVVKAEVQVVADSDVTNTPHNYEKGSSNFRNRMSAGFVR